MTFRQAQVEDLDVLLKLFFDTINNTCKKDYTSEQIRVWSSSIEDKAKWTRKIENQYFLVAELDKQIVGFGSLEHGNYIDLIYVHKDHLRKGIANQILETLKIKAKENGTEELSSDVSKTARHFFEKHGFAVVKKNEFMLDGVEISNYLMVRNI